MDRSNIFIPKNQQVEQTKPVKPTPGPIVVVEAYLRKIMQGLVVALIGLLPVFFLPGVAQSTSFDKVIVFTIGAGLIVLVGALLLPVTRRITTVVPTAVIGLCGLFIWGAVSAVVQGDLYDSLWGQQYESLTVLFAGLLVIGVLLPLLLQSSTKMLVRALILMGVSFAVVTVHTLLRYWFGVSFLDFGEFTSTSQSLVGGFNDAAIYAALVVVMSLVTLIMLPLRVFAQVIVSLATVCSLAILAVVNFSLLWYLLFFVSGVTTLYVLTRNMLFTNTVAARIGVYTKIVCVVVFTVSLLFSVFGTSMATALNNYTNAEFLEVRPSFSASVDVVKGVYEDNMWFGVGPNRYADAWRQHKDESINQTVFWNTDFDSGHSFVLSVFATYGLIGGLFLVLFHLLFIKFGLVRLVANADQNIFARYVTTFVFVGALFLWLITYIYTPSVTILLLAGFLTGLTYATSNVLEGAKSVQVPVSINRIRGYVFMLIAGLVVTLIVFAFISVSQKYSGQTSNAAQAGVEAEVKIAELQTLIAAASPDVLTQEMLIESTREALEAATVAHEMDETDPVHLERLANLYILLGSIGIDGGYDNAESSLNEAIVLDPKNPKYYVRMAQIALGKGDTEEAEEALEQATVLKQNYTDAILLQAEIDIASDDLEAAVAKVTSITRLDPTNPVRFYQLGLLHVAAEDFENAITAFSEALKIDPTYADARYLKALQLIALERTSEALEELYVVRETNSQNPELLSLIEQLESGAEVGTVSADSSFAVPEPVVDSESGVSVPSPVSSDLLAPVNDGGE